MEHGFASYFFLDIPNRSSKSYFSNYGLGGTITLDVVDPTAGVAAGRFNFIGRNTRSTPPEDVRITGGFRVRWIP